jgi:hypothetical protein
MAADAVQAFVERLRFAVGHVALAFGGFVLLRLVNNLAELHLATSLKRREVSCDGFGVFLRLWAQEQPRHLRRRAQRFRIENPPRHPIVVAPRPDAFERRRIHLQLRHAGVRQFRVGVTLDAAMIEEQFATHSELRGFLKFRRRTVREGRKRDRARERRLLRPGQTHKRVTFLRRSERGLERIRAFVQLNRLAERRCASSTDKLKRGRSIDLQFQSAVQFGLKGVASPQVGMDRALPDGGELATRQEGSGRFASFNV